MQESEAYAYFYRQRWPDGFVCPQCGHSACYALLSRSAPLYQCRRCRRQTSLTSGTAMERSRTPLAKWAQAFEALATSQGLNAAQLSKRIGVSHKIAWTMLRRIREAIGRVEADIKLSGRTHLGLMFLGTRNLQPFVPHPQEHAVLLGASVDPRTGRQTAIKLRVVPSDLLIRKRIDQDALSNFIETHVHPGADEVVWLRRFAPSDRSPIRSCFRQTAKWLYDLFHGLGRKYLQSYLDEYCFRHNVRASGMELKRALLSACFAA